MKSLLNKLLNLASDLESRGIISQYNLDAITDICKDPMKDPGASKKRKLCPELCPDIESNNNITNSILGKY